MRLPKDAKTHKRRDKKGQVIKEYTTKLKVSRVMQVYKSSVLREALRRDPESAEFVTRRDFKIQSTGFATEEKVGVASRLAEVGSHSVHKALVAFKKK